MYLDDVMREYTLGLSIDPNTKNTGVVYWNNREPIRWEDVKPLGKPESFPQWLRMSLAIWRIILLERPDWVCIEGVYSGPNARVTADLNRLVGNVLTYCVFRFIPVFELSTAHIDTLNGIDHKGRKQSNMQLAKLLLHEKEVKVTQDVADAMACGMAGHVLYTAYKLSELNPFDELPLPA